MGSTPTARTKYNTSVAQLDRVPGYEPGGCRFESYQMCHLLNVRGKEMGGLTLEDAFRNYLEHGEGYYLKDVSSKVPQLYQPLEEVKPVPLYWHSKTIKNPCFCDHLGRRLDEALIYKREAFIGVELNLPVNVAEALKAGSEVTVNDWLYNTAKAEAHMFLYMAYLDPHKEYEVNSEEVQKELKNIISGAQLEEMVLLGSWLTYVPRKRVVLTGKLKI